MKVPRLGVESELRLLAYSTATAMPDPSGVCDLHHRSWQHQILNPLSEARDGTLVLMDTVRFVTTESQRELQGLDFKCILKPRSVPGIQNSSLPRMAETS